MITCAIPYRPPWLSREMVLAALLSVTVADMVVREKPRTMPGWHRASAFNTLPGPAPSRPMSPPAIMMAVQPTTAPLGLTACRTPHTPGVPPSNNDTHETAVTDNDQPKEE